MKKSLCSYILLLIPLVILPVYAASELRPAAPLPTMGVCARSVTVSGDSLSFTWQVTNYSDQPMTFEEDSVFQLRSGFTPISYPVPAQTLPPGETFSMEVLLEGFDNARSRNLYASAACNEGTSGTTSVPIPSDTEQDISQPAAAE